ncbi:toprim domain-containing protein [Patescibacteria group bacterium]|nr:toprim domain-containing protein [Patescibacteria group bacterium]MBU4353657.1 toprim domain-containing protein [Patescibacteria group bacterium]MBU4476883.1 toprim domain-containing protein [Patescibacteria group bacterium]MCG2699096.1 toprim domain-containing protein [Candidatus Parcubacteria bacterium]
MNNNFEKLIEYFLKFPGIGPRQAKRFALFLAGEDKKFVADLGQLISKIKESVRQCPSCYRFYGSVSGGSSQCGICSNLNRDNSILLVVEKDADLQNIEKSEVYNGRYFVLGGTIPLANGSAKGGTGGLRFRELFEKVKVLLQSSTREAKHLEVILALSATIEGENTSRYAEKILEPLLSKGGQEIKITRLGRGLSTGTELEYSDSATIANSLRSRC